MTQQTLEPKSCNTVESQRLILEKSLAMRAEAYQSQLKAKLLTQVIMQIENSKKTLQSLNDKLAREIANRKKIEKKIMHMASHDHLTGLPNRSLFNDRLSNARNMAIRNREKLAVLFIDLDGFKAVNDTLGHKAGDLLLKEVARRLQACVRKSDTVARFGGDEFIVLLNSLHRLESVEVVAKKILSTIEQPMTLADNAATIGSSIGIAIFPDHSEDTEKLVNYADDAMYLIKKSGKNTYSFYGAYR
ncbi:MAG: diguanylate cyclase domain-containing protein [Gammaproteobacteria bacterium]